jgi:hypothetical protein
MRRVGCRQLVFLALSLLAAGLPLQAQTGDFCGLVVEESQTQVADAEVHLFAADGTEPLATTTDGRGEFCFRGLAAGSYAFQVVRKPWPAQPRHTVEVLAGDTSLRKVELEYEPGEPRASFGESLDGLGPDDRRAVLEGLLVAGDTESLRELARRLVPKRSVAIELGRLTRGLETRRLVDELIRWLERGYLPPLKTARFLHALGELGTLEDDRIIALLLRKLTDGRRLPPGNYVTWAGLYDPARQYYVSDEALLALTKLSGKDFNYELGRSPLANQRAIENAREWWRQEVAKKSERERRP